MPELIEVELYRRALDPLLGETVEHVDLLDPNYLRPNGASPESLTALEGTSLAATMRIGKLLLIDLRHACNARDPSYLGLRFGMTGRLVIDGAGPIERLEYSSGRNNPDWDRVRLLIGGRQVAVRDPRRLGSIDIDPAFEDLGPDAATIELDAVATALRDRTASLKAVLLRQDLLAGLGNLLADEVLFAARLDPRRPGGSLSEGEVARLHATTVETIALLTERGGSHTGDLFPQRSAEGICPLDGTTLRSSRLGGRTTWWCPHHQR
jgi:formamidopyrimidine-DNA glycosylase